jgi:hypothetical protein
MEVLHTKQPVSGDTTPVVPREQAEQQAVRELSALELSLVGGGIGDVSFV